VSIGSEIANGRYQTISKEIARTLLVRFYAASAGVLQLWYMPEQYRAIGWVGAKLYALIFEVREDKEGEYYHLVTLWKATKQEQQLYEEHS